VKTGFGWGNLWEENHMEDPGVDGRVILNLIFKKWGGSGYGQVKVYCECGNEHSGCMKCGEFLD
jgi:hypothetical protein